MPVLPWRRIWTVALFDLGAPIALTIATAHELAYDGAPPTKWIAAMALVWVLVVRRRFPVVVFAVCMVLAALLSLWSPTVGELSLLVALYTVAAHRRLGVALGAALVLEVGVVVGVLRYAPSQSIDDYLVVLSGVAAAALFLGTTMRANRQYLRVVEDRAARLERERVQQAELAAADERARIAREMHDIVAHGLAVVVTLADGAALTATKDPARAASAMHQVADAGRSSLEEMRRLLRVLRTDGAPELAPQPELRMLETLVDDVRAAGPEVTLRNSVDAAELDGATQATLFRLVQEALTNVLKHAPTSRRIDIDIERSPGGIVFGVENAGAVRPVEHTHTTASIDGNGIVGMRERVAAFGGSLDVGPTDDGWFVRGVLPTAAMQEPIR
jgi:signal transduction histidine kinase